jgi:hypothetical protein
MIFTEQEIQNNLISNCFHREVEIHGYQINIDNYTTMLSSLPTTDWDSDIENYRNSTISDLPHSLTDEQIDRINDFQYRDKLRILLRTERSEQNKSQRVLDALKSQITGDYVALLQQYKQTQ